MYLRTDPLDVTALLAELTSASDGAVVSFAGVVRNHHRGRAVVAIEYTAYPEMAEPLLDAIRRETEQRWTVRTVLAHRIGRLAVGETAVVAAAVAPHREAAFAACRELIDQVKARVPIWKHEYYADGSAAWVDPTRDSGPST